MIRSLLVHCGWLLLEETREEAPDILDRGRLLRDAAPFLAATRARLAAPLGDSLHVLTTAVPSQLQILNKLVRFHGVQRLPLRVWGISTRETPQQILLCV